MGSSDIWVIGNKGDLGEKVCEGKAYKILPRFFSLSYLWIPFNKKNVIINCAVKKQGIFSQIISNLILPIYLSFCCKKLIHICSDCVYDKSLKTAHSVASPKKIDSVYSFTKIVSAFLLEKIGNAVIFRTSFISKSNKLLQKIRKNGSIIVDSGLILNPVGVGQLAKIIQQEAEINRLSFGVYHVASKTAISKYRLASYIKKEFNSDSPISGYCIEQKNRCLLADSVFCLDFPKKEDML